MIENHVHGRGRDVTTQPCAAEFYVYIIKYGIVDLSFNISSVH